MSSVISLSLSPHSLALLHSASPYLSHSLPPPTQPTHPPTAPTTAPTAPTTPTARPAPQDPHLRPNFTAVVDMLDEIVASGCVAKLDIMYWSRPGGFA